MYVKILYGNSLVTTFNKGQQVVIPTSTYKFLEDIKVQLIREPVESNFMLPDNKVMLTSNNLVFQAKS